MAYVSVFQLVRAKAGEPDAPSRRVVRFRLGASRRPADRRGCRRPAEPRACPRLFPSGLAAQRRQANGADALFSHSPPAATFCPLEAPPKPTPLVASMVSVRRRPASGPLGCLEIAAALPF